MCSECSEKYEAIQEALWLQIKTLSALMERIEKEGDRLQELYQAAAHDRQQAQAAIWEKHLRDRIDNPGEQKKGALKHGDNRIIFSKAENSL